jgi:hypothetical protein
MARQEPPAMGVGINGASNTTPFVGNSARLSSPKSGSYPGFPALFCTFENWRAADSPTRWAGERSPSITAIVLDVELTAGSRFLEFDNRGISIAFVAAGQPADRCSSSRRTGGVDVASMH